MLMLLVPGLAFASPLASCARSYTVDELREAAAYAQARWALGDTSGTVGAMALVDGRLECVGAPLDAPAAADVHRAKAVGAAASGDDTRASQAFAAALAVDPAHAVADSVVPAGTPWRARIDEISIRPTAAATDKIVLPNGVTAIVDGAHSASAPPDRAAVVQAIGADGAVLETRYRWPGGDLSGWPGSGKAVPGNVAGRPGSRGDGPSPTAGEAGHDVTDRKARLELGAGVMSDRGVVSGPAVAARFNVGHGLLLEAEAYLRLPGLEPATGLDRTLLDIAYQGDQNTTYQQPITVDAFHVLLLANWGFLPRARAGGFTGGPRIDGGIGLRANANYHATPSAEYRDCGGCDADLVISLDQAETTFHPFVAAGVAMDGWYAGRIGLQLRWLQHTWIGPEPDYGNIDPNTGQAKALEDTVLSQATFSTSFVFAF